MTNIHARNLETKVTKWTKKGIVRLGFFIKSQEAKKFRDWAEDYIVNGRGTPTQAFDLSPILSIMENQTRILEHISVQNSVMLSLMDRLSKYEDTMHFGLRVMMKNTDLIWGKLNNEQPYSSCLPARVKITVEQRAAIQEHISERARCLSEVYGIQTGVIATSMYVGLKSRFGVIYYGDICVSDYDDAVVYIDNFDIGR